MDGSYAEWGMEGAVCWVRGGGVGWEVEYTVGSVRSNCMVREGVRAMCIL